MNTVYGREENFFQSAIGQTLNSIHLIPIHFNIISFLKLLLFNIISVVRTTLTLRYDSGEVLKAVTIMCSSITLEYNACPVRVCIILLLYPIQ